VTATRRVDNLVDEKVDKPPSGAVRSGLGLVSTDREGFPGGAKQAAGGPNGYP
jgi:hypothetical protein